jgi:chemotaxis protein MotB
VYIDQGRRDGLYVGDRLEVFRVTTGLPMRLIGEIKVLAVEESTATTQIVRSLVPFLKGDRVTFKPPAAKELAKGAEGAAPAESVSEELERLESASRESEAKEAPQEAQAGEQSPEALLADLARQLEFDPGQAPVKPKGLPILKRIGEILKQIPDKRARIEGHADDRPIGPSLKGLFPGNQELSEARATGVVQYLVEEEGVDPSTLSAVGHGDTKPVANNKTEAGRKQNRRIEIVLLPKEPAAPPSAPGGPAEAPPPAPAQPQTAAPPASTPPAP